MISRILNIGILRDLFTEADRKVGHPKASLATGPTNVWRFASAAVLHKGLVHSFSARLWKSDSYDLRSQIRGIDKRRASRRRSGRAPPQRRGATVAAGEKLCSGYHGDVLGWTLGLYFHPIDTYSLHRQFLQSRTRHRY